MTENLDQSVPSPLQLRAMLEEMVVTDLLGPTAPDEEIDESSVRDRYLVGVLAPVRQQVDQHAEPTSAEGEEDDEAINSGGDFPPDDQLAVGGVDTVDEGPTDLSPPQPKAIFPSSFGMTFSVDLDATDLHVTANWGQYLREKSEYLTTEKGNPKRVWKRVQRGGEAHTIKLQQGSIVGFDADFNCPEVRIEGVIRRRDSHWSVTLFLVNKQPEPDSLRDTAWLFQPELTVDAPDRSAVF